MEATNRVTEAPHDGPSLILPVYPPEAPGLRPEGGERDDEGKRRQTASRQREGDRGDE